MERRKNEDENFQRFVGGFQRQVCNSELQCARCANRWDDSTAACEVFEQKPLYVLRGERRCPEFAAEQGVGE